MAQGLSGHWPSKWDCLGIGPLASDFEAGPEIELLRNRTEQSSVLRSNTCVPLPQ